MFADITLPKILLVVAIVWWFIANVQFYREERRWVVDTDDAIFFMLLAIYTRFA